MDESWDGGRNAAAGTATDAEQACPIEPRAHRQRIARSRALASVLAVGLAVASALSLFGRAEVDAAPVCTKTYSGPAGGDWETAANWSPAGLPGAGDTVCSATGSPFKLHSVVSVQAADLDDTLDVLAGAHLSVTDAGTTSQFTELAVTGGAVDLAGDATFNGGSTTVTAGGRIDNAGRVTVMTGALSLSTHGRVDGNGGIEIPTGGALDVTGDDDFDSAAIATATTATHVHLDGGVIEGFASAISGASGMVTDLHVDRGRLLGDVWVEGDGRLSGGRIAAGAEVRTTDYADSGTAVTKIDGHVTIEGALRTYGATIAWNSSDISLCGELIADAGDITVNAAGATASDCSASHTAMVDALSSNVTIGALGQVVLEPRLENHSGEVHIDGALRLPNGGHARNTAWSVGGSLDVDGGVLDISDDVHVAVSGPTGITVHHGARLRLSGDDNPAGRATIDLVRIDGGTLEGVPAVVTHETGEIASLDMATGFVNTGDAYDPVFERSALVGELTLTASSRIGGGTVSGTVHVAPSAALRLAPELITYEIVPPGGGLPVATSGYFLTVGGRILADHGDVRWDGGDLEVCGSIELDSGALLIANNSGTPSTMIDCSPADSAFIDARHGPMEILGDVRIEPKVVVIDEAVRVGTSLPAPATAELAGGGFSSGSTWELDPTAPHDTHVRFTHGTFETADDTRFLPSATEVGAASFDVMPGATLLARAGSPYALLPALRGVHVLGGALVGTEFDGWNVPPLEAPDPEVIASGMTRPRLRDLHVESGSVSGAFLSMGDTHLSGGTVTASVWQNGALSAGSITVDGPVRIEGEITSRGLPLRWASSDFDLCGVLTSRGPLAIDAVGATVHDCNPGGASRIVVSSSTVTTVAGDATIGVPLTVEATADITVTGRLTLAATMASSGASWHLPDPTSTVAFTGGDSSLSGDAFTGPGTFDVQAGGRAGFYGPVTGAANVHLAGGTLAGDNGYGYGSTIGNLDAESGTVTGVVDVLVGGTIDDLTVTGQLVLNPYAGASLIGAVTVDGSLVVDGATVTNTGTLTVNGELRLDGAAITNDGTVTIHGTGTEVSGASTSTITNHAGHALLTDGHVAWPHGDVVNEGSVSVNGTGSLTARYSQTGGTTDLATTAATLTSATPAAFSGGELVGVGTFVGDVTDAPVPGAFVVKPGGDGLGTLHITGAFIPQGADVIVQAQGTAVGTYDRIAVTGPAGLASSPTGLGQLTFESVAGFVPTVGDRFSVITAASHRGPLFATIVDHSGSAGFVAAVPGAVGGGIDAMIFTPPSVSVGDTTVAEPAFSSGTAIAHVPVTLSGPAPAAISVAWSTADGTATAGSDYTAATGSVSFAPFQTTATIDVTVAADQVHEPTETFVVNLGVVTGKATLGPDSQSGVTIFDDLYDIADNCSKWAVGSVDWSSAAQWLPVGVPSPSDVVCGMPGSTITVGGATTRSVFGVSSLGTLTIDAGSSLSFTGGTEWSVQTLNINGTLTGHGQLGVTGGGSIVGEYWGPSTLRIEAGATFTWTRNGWRNAAVVENHGTLVVNQPYGVHEIGLCEGSRIINHATMNIVGDDYETITDCGAASSGITNAAGGTLTVSIFNNSHTLAVALDNQGAMDVQSGTLYLLRTNTVPNGGTLTIDSAMYLRSESAATPATHRFGATAVVAGAGPLVADGGDTILEATAGSAFNHLIVAGASVLHGSPTLTGDSALSGHYQGPGTATVNAGATFSWSAGGLSDAAVINNHGTVAWIDTYGNASSIELCGGSQLVNHGIVTMRGDDSAQLTDCGSTTSRFTNASDGTIDSNFHPYATHVVAVAFDNQGALAHLSGTLELRRTNTIAHTGTFTIELPAALALRAESPAVPATHTFGATAVTTGSGSLVLDNGDALVSATAGAHFAHVAIEGNGVLTGSPTITSTSHLYGHIQGPGTVTIDPAATFTWVFGGLRNGAVLDNKGTLEWADAYGNGTLVELCDGSQVVNHGAMNLTGDDADTVTDCGAAASKITNAADGTITVATHPWATRYVIAGFANQGTIKSQSGSLWLANGLDNITGATITGGSFELNAAIFVANTTAGQVTTNASSFTFDPGGAFLTLGSQPILALTRNTTAGALVYDQNVTFGPFTNEGALTLRPNRTLTSASYSQPAGSTTIMNGANLSPASGRVDLDGGLLAGSYGVVNASVYGNGSISPGNGARDTATLSVGGWFPGPAGHLMIDVTQYGTDHLAVGNAGAPLAGTLDILTAAGYSPPLGTVFDAAGGTSGAFGAVTGDLLPNGTRYDVAYPGGDVTLTVVEGLTVNSTEDRPDWNPNDGVCRTFYGTCTLRAAIQQANATPGHNHINLTPGATYGLTRAGINEDLGSTGDLDIRDTLTISGNGATIDAHDLDRVFEVHPGVAAHLDRVTVRNGRTDGNGGGVLATNAALTVTSSTFTANHTPNGTGAGLHLDGTGSLVVTATTVTGNDASNAGGIGANGTGTVTITASTVTNNSGNNVAGGIGGAGEGVFNVSGSTVSGNTNTGIFGGGIGVIGTLNLTGSTVSGNHAPQGFGGGVVAFGAGHITTSTITGNDALAGGGLSTYGPNTLDRSTLDHNSATGGAGAILNMGTLAITASTISQNSTPLGGNTIANLGDALGLHSTLTLTSSTVTANTGGGIANDPGATFAVGNSIIADQATGTDCSGPIISAGYNHSSDTTCPFAGPGDTQGTPALLGPLATNGGPTKTHLPQPGSPAIGTGNPTCTGIDQRGVTRPSGGACDKGAVEV